MSLPLVPPVSQFDGSAYASANCAAASAARLRWYMTGEKTTGAQIRAAQYDKLGGISLPDCGRAFSNLLPVVHPAWAAPTDGVPNPPGQQSTSITQSKLEVLLKTGQMVLIQGDYGNLPLQYRKQGDFTDDHTFTADALRVHPITKRREYYVVDTIPRPNTAYDGEWIPATAIMSYAYGLAGQGRIFAMWGKPKPPPVEPEWEAVIHPEPGEKRPFLVYRVRDHDDRPLQITSHDATRTGGSTYRVKAPIAAVRGPGFPPDAVLPKGLCRLIEAVPHLPPGGYLDVALCHKKQ